MPISIDGSGTIVGVNQLLTAGIPAGAILPFAMNTVPTGWLMADGSAVARTGTYALLYAAIGVSYGNGNGTTTFNLPDLRGQFIRGWANGQSTDPDRASRTDRGDGTTGDAVGTKQNYAVESHVHSYTYTSRAGANYIQDGGYVNHTLANTTGAYGGNETRPINIYMMYCIKY